MDRHFVLIILHEKVICVSCGEISGRVIWSPGPLNQPLLTTISLSLHPGLRTPKLTGSVKNYPFVSYNRYLVISTRFVLDNCSEPGPC